MPPAAAAHRRTALITVTGGIIPLPGYSKPPTDPNGDGKYEDLDGDGHVRFNDVVIFFSNMEWIAANEPIPAFDFNGNGRIDFNDVVKLVSGVVITYGSDACSVYYPWIAGCSPHGIRGFGICGYRA